MCVSFLDITFSKRIMYKANKLGLWYIQRQSIFCYIILGRNTNILLSQPVSNISSLCENTVVRYCFQRYCIVFFLVCEKRESIELLF